MTLPQRRPVGRPSIYCHGYAIIARKLRRLGVSVKDIADIFDVSTSTIHEWRQRFPDFSRAWKEGGAIADAEVANALYHKAIGYQHPAEKLFYDNKSGEVVRAAYTQHNPPDSKAMRLWLINRQPEIWKSARTANEVSGADGQPLLRPIIVTEPVCPSPNGPVIVEVVKDEADG